MTAYLPPAIRFQPLVAGSPLPGGKVYFYQAGTTTPQAAYAADGTTPLANPLTLDANGATDFRLGAGLTYKINLTDSVGGAVLGWPVDQIAAESATALLSANLADSSDVAKGDALIAVKQHLTGATARTQHDKNAESVSVLDFGADPTGVASSTSAIEAAYSAIPAGGTLLFPPGTYKIGVTTLSGKNVSVFAYGATFNLVGDGAGFFFRGVISRLVWQGGKIVGDGADRWTGTLPQQIGISVATYAGDDASNITIQDVWVYQPTVGFRIAYGTTPNNTVDRCYIVNCHIDGAVGKAAGYGYGIQFSQAPGSTVIGGSIRNCQRHGLYFAEGERYRAIGVEISGCGYNDGTLKGAVNVSRSADVGIVGCTIHDNFDVGMLVDADGQGITPNDPNGLIVSATVFRGNKYGDVVIYYTGGASFVPRSIIFDACLFKTPGSRNSPNFTLQAGYLVTVQNCTFDATDMTLPAGSTVRFVTLSASQGATYTDGIVFRNNTFKRSPASSDGICYQVEAAICTGTSNVLFDGTKMLGTNMAEFEFIGGEGSITNNNLLYKRSNGTCTRTVTTTGAGITIPVGGVDKLIFTQGSATTISGLSGATEGQELTLYFTNGNVTVNEVGGVIYLSAGANFVGTQYDTLTLCYLGGAWREKSRSANA